MRGLQARCRCPPYGGFAAVGSVHGPYVILRFFSNSVALTDEEQLSFTGPMYGGGIVAGEHGIDAFDGHQVFQQRAYAVCLRPLQGRSL